MGWQGRGGAARPVLGVSAVILIILVIEFVFVLRSCREAETHGTLSYALVLSKTFPSLLSLLRPSFIRNVIKLHPFGSLYGRCARYFKTERMRRAFSFGSM